MSICSSNSDVSLKITTSWQLHSSTLNNVKRLPMLLTLSCIPPCCGLPTVPNLNTVDMENHADDLAHTLRLQDHRQTIGLMVFSITIGTGDIQHQQSNHRCYVTSYHKCKHLQCTRSLPAALICCCDIKYCKNLLWLRSRILDTYSLHGTQTWLGQVLGVTAGCRLADLDWKPSK